MQDQNQGHADRQKCDGGIQIKQDAQENQNEGQVQQACGGLSRKDLAQRLKLAKS